ncbi:MAG TPA: diphthamide synthesis protein [Candidatus Nanoarchaeia archaeon]|nr:diphthamide synthesis protein [Candidatus Nanoarchaeia archaeon]
MEITLKELNERYDFEFEKVLKNIKNENPRNVVLQFPDGLKQYSRVIVDYFRKKLKRINFFIWLGSCYGACDFPVVLNTLKGEEKIDMMIQFGHNEKMPDY